MNPTYWPAFRTADGITFVYGADFDSQDEAFSAGRALGCLLGRAGEHVAVLHATRDQVVEITAGIRKRDKQPLVLPDPDTRGPVQCAYCTNPAVRRAVVRPCRHAATLCLLHAAEVQTFLAKTDKPMCKRCGQHVTTVDLRPL